MRELLTEKITIRLTADEYQKYLVAAAQASMSVSEYLRLRLSSVNDERVAEEIAQLRFTVLDSMDVADGHDDPTILLEVLLLLRHICQPSAVRVVQAELQRLGCSPWTPSTP